MHFYRTPLPLGDPEAVRDWWIVAHPAPGGGYWISRYAGFTLAGAEKNLRNLSQSYENIVLYDAEKKPVYWKGSSPEDLDYLILVHELRIS